jgi:hypothetical protein
MNGAKKGPKTLLEWAVCGKDEKKEEQNKTDKNGEKANGKEGEADQKNTATGETEQKQQNTEQEPEPEEPEEEGALETDRPDFTEASSTVGRGRIQLEAGYTFFTDREGGTTSRLHSFPEMLWRIGMFADWFELRIGQNFAHVRTVAFEEILEDVGGANDLYLGVKLALTEQKKSLPETALILQTFVPTGHDDFTAGELLPGFNYLFGWDIVEDCLSAGGSFQINRLVEDDHFFVVVAQSMTVGYRLSPQIGAYTEWFAFYPAGSISPDVGPEHYFDGGFTYLVNDNFQLDIRAGVGLNDHAVDFFTGAGFGLRY